MFKVKGYREPLVSNKYPIFSLSTDNWDDYGTVCTFKLRYHKSKTEIIEIGEVKILQKDKERTELPPKFDDLDESYISLGQSLNRHG